MSPTKTAILALFTGLACGGIFGLLRLPIPAPPTFAGLLGIVGIFLGFLIVNLLIDRGV